MQTLMIVSQIALVTPTMHVICFTTIPAKMGGLCEERSEKGRGGSKVERKGQQQQGPMEMNHKSSRTSE